MNGQSSFHSVELRDDICKGCTICVTSCPVEAIRVHDGKAHILEEQCIDCGECIRRCPSHAKYARTTSLSELEKYKTKVALAAPAFYAQFDEVFERDEVRKALLSLGFDDVADISDAAGIISAKTAEYIHSQVSNKNHIAPLISSSCPAVLKLIQIRFPSLIEHILPLIPPSEYAARTIRKKYGDDCGIFLISPCPAKMTVARSPLGYNESEIDGVFAISKIYLPVLLALKKNGSHNNISTNIEEIEQKEASSSMLKSNIPGVRSRSWCSASGEAECLELCMNTYKDDCRWVSASGISEVLQALEDTEDGLFDKFDYLELSACTGGCLGGPLAAVSAPQAESVLRRRMQKAQLSIKNQIEKSNLPDLVDVLFSEEIIPRPSRLLSPDFEKARKMMQKMEEITTELGGLDCGSCGAPNCRALAEDIVKNKAKKEDCVIILKARYENMLFGEKNK